MKNKMEIIIQTNEAWFKKDFDICLDSLFKNTKNKYNLFFIIGEDTKKGIVNKINKLKGDSAQKKISKNVPLIIIKAPILFYSNWNIKLLKAYNKLGNKYNYVPSYINHRGEQLSILNKVYPHDLLFDLDYKRDPMKKKNIDYFNDLCALQYKKVKVSDDWIILYTDKDLKEKETICVLSCVVAKLKR